ncbi:hypothetical protein ACMZ75_00110 [Gardnerella piotii]|uniref:hypothetical protein n=1 Tax=Gardnerella piotii TaxID=2792977 RepID=UPI000352A9B7|nr:hypothetical protein HMPREF1579_00965 [Gardnerella vaginalis JCP8066]
MFKRLFWICIGFVMGVMSVTKARAYVKEKLPQNARNFFFDKDPKNLTLSTILSLYNDFNSSRKAHESQINSKYASKYADKRDDSFANKSYTK